jgi:hypothetical protein
MVAAASVALLMVCPREFILHLFLLDDRIAESRRHTLQLPSPTSCQLSTRPTPPLSFQVRSMRVFRPCTFSVATHPNACRAVQSMCSPVTCPRHMGQRPLPLHRTVALAITPPHPPTNLLLAPGAELLERTKENQPRYNRERLYDYYRRNFKVCLP